MIGEENMWIGLNDGWLSIVENWNDEDTLLVRARKLEHLLNAFPACEYWRDLEADYPFRAYIPRSAVAKMIAKKIENIDYPNFKNSVEEKKLAYAYGDVWQTMFYTYRSER
tara:strand:- start:87 stop:419 length:333 start_codon:yes stop_codon:yes gene_type:complete